MKTINDLRRGRWAAFSLCLYFGLGLGPLLARTFIIPKALESGPGSLSEALTESLPGDRIELDPISGKTIILTRPLPSVPVFVQITNSGAAVIVDGTNAGATAGLAVNGYAGIRGLELRNFNGAGVSVAGPGVVLRNVAAIGNTGSGVDVQSGANNTTMIDLTSTGNTQHGLALAAVQFLRVTGTVTITNNGGDGINGTGVNYSVFAPPYVPLVGDFGPPLSSAPHLVISGNGGAGIRLDGANYNVIRGAYIGTDFTGTAAQPNAAGGIILTAFSYNLIGGAYPGQGNLISGNTGPGLTMGDSGSPNFRNQIFGNFFGTDINGTAGLSGLPGDGIVINNASENVIGGNTFTGPTDSPAGRSNLFSGNGSPIVIENPLAVSNVVRGNLIGTDPTDTLPVGNDDGVFLFQAGSDNFIGGPNPGDGNVIGATGNSNPALRIDLTSGTVVQGNFFGTDATGTINLGNTGTGIFISQGSNNTIGGREAGEENLILLQGIDGVGLTGPNANNNLVAGNSIFLNTGQGVNLQGGANNSVTPPVVDSAVTSNGVTTVTGSFTGPANTQFFIDLYANPTGQVGSGSQGRDYLGGDTFATLANGTGTFQIAAPAVPAGNNLVNATKTDPAGNSSGFAAATTVSNGTASTDLVVEKTVAGRSGREITYGIGVFNNGLDSAENVSLTDIVPGELTVVSCGAAGGQCVVNGNKVTATLGTLANQEGRSILITAKIPDSFPSDFIGKDIKNAARATSTTPDPDQGNNVGKVTTRIGVPKLSGPPDDQRKEGSGGTASSTDRISTFDTDTDGWGVSNTNPLIHKPSGGNPGGFIFLDNDEQIVALLVAPPKFLGDLSGFNGGTLSFDGNMLQQNAPPWDNVQDYGHVFILGGSSGATASVDFVPGQPPEKSWATFSKPLTASTWGMTETEWKSLLSNADNIFISIEARFGAEMQGVDNIKLLAPKPPFVAPNQELNAPVITAGTTENAVTVTVPEGLTETVTVDFETVDGTAVAGEDYVPIAGTLIFPPGTTSQSFNVVIIGDDAREADETFSVRFSNPVNADLETTETVITILDDDGGYANISTRLAVGTGDNVLIGGFIIPDSAQSTETKKVLLRAIGPSLPLTGKLADPKLILFDSTGAMIGSNDNWRTTQIGGVITSDNVDAIEASTIPPTDDNESAMVVDLPVGAYTAILSGVNDTTGIGLVEVYDLDSVGPLRLANISTRGFVNTGDNVMIGGLISLGSRAQTFLARAIGPSLVDAGVSNALQDPALELYDFNGALVDSNDNWRSDQEADIIATGIPPTDDAESALVATLMPGAYTGVVRGVGNTIGVALVEFYRLE